MYIHTCIHTYVRKYVHIYMHIYTFYNEGFLIGFRYVVACQVEHC